MKPTRVSALRGLAALNTMSFTAFQLILVTLYPFIAERLELSVATVIACFSAGSFCFLWGSPFWAAKGDLIGRQRIIRLGLAGLFFSLIALAGLLLGGVRGPVALALLLASRLVYGLTASAIVPSSQALQADLAENGGAMKAMLNHSLSLNLGRVLGPLLVLVTGAKTETLLLSCIGWAFGLMILNRAMPTLRQASIRRPAPPSLAAVLKSVSGVFAVALLFTIFLEALNASLATTLKQVFSLGSLESSALMARLLLAGSALMLITQIASRLWLRLDWRRGLLAGGLILVAGAVLFSRADSSAGLWTAIAALSIAIGLVPPSYMAALSDVGPKDGHHGGRAGWIGSAHTLGYALGGAFAALALRFDGGAFVLLPCLAVATAVSVCFLLRRVNFSAEVKPC